MTKLATDRAAGWRATTARSVDELSPIHEGWERLRGHHVTADPEHFRIVLEHRPQALRPHVVLLEHDGEPVAMAIGRIEELRLPAKIGYRTVVAPRLRVLTVVDGGLLGVSSEGTARRLLELLRGALAAGEADALRLRLLEVGSPMHTLARAEGSLLTRERAAPPTPHWQTTIPDSYEAFLKRLSGSMRRNIRYYGKKLVEEYGDRLRLETFHDGEDLERLYADTATVAAKTYQHALGSSFTDDALRRALDDLAIRRGWFRAYLLYLDDVPVAFWFGLAHRGVLATGVTGYDPAFAKQRVGTFLLARLIEDACADPEIELVDYGYGDAEYKRHFGDRHWLEQDVLVYAPTFRGVRANLSRSAVTSTAELARRIVGGEGAVARLKRGWRTRLRRSA